MKAVHFGAGNIGRGFIGDILNRNNFETCFIDVNQDIIDEINNNNSYQVELIDENQTVFTVNNVSALNSVTQEDEVLKKILDADIITTSVGVENLDKIANILKKSLYKRATQQKIIDVIANENMIGATDLLKKKISDITENKEFELIEKHTGFVNSAIDRQALSKKTEYGDIALVEPYFEWVVDRKEFKKDILTNLEGITYVTNIDSYVERKLYIVNAGHAAAAYLGSFLNKNSVQEALADKKTYSFVEKLMNENAEYLIAKYNMGRQDLDKFIKKTMKRHSNPIIKDDVKRVGRSPIRKLGENERLVGPLLQLDKFNLPLKYGEKIIAVTLHFANSDDLESLELCKNIESIGVKDTLKKYSNIKNTKILNKIDNIFNEIEVNKLLVFEE